MIIIELFKAGNKYSYLLWKYEIMRLSGLIFPCVFFLNIHKMEHKGWISDFLSYLIDNILFGGKMGLWKNKILIVHCFDGFFHACLIELE